MSVAKTAPAAIKLLWKDKFLLAAKTKDEILLELEKAGYNFDEGATRKALERADFITRKGTQGDRKFVQKYPFTEEYEQDK